MLAPKKFFQKILKQLENRPQELVPKNVQDSTMSTQDGRTFKTCRKSMNPIQVLNLPQIVEQNENTLN